MTRLKPRVGSYENALDAFASGDFQHSAELLSESAALTSVLLHARALLRLGRPEDALELIDASSSEACSHELAAELLIVKATALNLLHRFEESATVVFEARVRCFSSGIPAIEAELLLATAVGSMLAGDDVAARTAALAVLNLDRTSPTWLPKKTYRLSLEFFRSRACDLIGAIERSRSHFIEQLAWHRQALEEFENSGVKDDFMEAAVLSNYADAALAVGVPEAIDFAITRSKRIDWTPFLAEYEFRVFSALAEASSVAGDQLGALRLFRRCMACAPTAALQIRAAVERARILSEIGEAFSSREELDHALRISKSVRWETVCETDQRQLIYLAGQVASYSASESQRLLKRYDGLNCSLPTSVAVRDDRFRAEELLARGAVLRASGDVNRSIVTYIDALGIFTSSGCSVKAAYAAGELAELTHELKYAEILRAHCEQKPHSILTRKLARFDAWATEAVTA